MRKNNCIKINIVYVAQTMYIFFLTCGNEEYVQSCSATQQMTKCFISHIIKVYVLELGSWAKEREYATYVC